MSDPYRPSAAAWLQSTSPHPALAVAGVPWDAGSHGAGTPAAVRAVLTRFSTVHSESGADLESLGVDDTGDWPIGDDDLAAQSAEIERRAGRLDRSPRHVFLGGDPALTRPIVNGLGPAGMGILTFGSFNRVGPVDGPANGTVLRGLVEDGVPGECITQVGAHGFANSADEHAFCDEHGISQYPMDTVDLWGMEETVTVALDQLASTCERIHVSFDMSVLDAAHAPGCSDSRPGGLTARRLSNAAFQCGRAPRVRSADFVGVDAAADHHDLAVMNLAGAFLSFAGGLASRRTPDP